MANKAVQLIVRGRVQGVYFRASAQRECRRLGATGWVKNRSDGNVEMLVEGDENVIRDVMAWAQRGPSASRVEYVDVRWKSYTGEFDDFEIRD
jgi:acylphosphatase